MLEKRALTYLALWCERGSCAFFSWYIFFGGLLMLLTSPSLHPSLLIPVVGASSPTRSAESGEECYEAMLWLSFDELDEIYI